MDKKYKIYFLKHPITKEIRYIGQTSKSLKERLNGHLNYDNKVSRKANWIKSLKKIGLIPEIEFICSYETNQECDEEEIKLIKEYKENGYRLTNDAPGGRSNAGCKRSEETKKKLSLRMKGRAAWNKGKKFSEETRKKISLSKIGKKWKQGRNYPKSLSEQHKKNIGNSIRGDKNGFYGKKHTKETKEKLQKINKSPEAIKRSINNLKNVTKESIERGRLKRIGWKQTEDAKRRIKESLAKTFAIRKKLKEKAKKTGQLYLF
jgi:group I intron endonuclease